MKMLLFTILLAFVFVTGPSYANEGCDPKAAQAALHELKIFSAKLLDLPGNKDGNDGTPNAAVRLYSALSRAALKQWIDADIACQPADKFEVNVMNGGLQNDIKDIVGHYSTDDHHPYGLNFIHLKFYPEQSLLFITASFGAPCTDDVLLLGYRHGERFGKTEWQRVFDIGSDDTPGFFKYYRFREPAFIKDPGTGRTVMLLTINPSQCTSFHYGFAFLVVDPENNEQFQKILFSRRGMYYNGELNDDYGPDVTIQGNRFQLSYFDPSFADGAVEKPTIETYLLKDGAVRRETAPIKNSKIK